MNKQVNLPKLSAIKQLAFDLKRIDTIVDSVETRLKDIENRKYRDLADRLIIVREILARWL